MSIAQLDNQREIELTMARWHAYQEYGETVSHEAMLEWLESWGTENEKSCPAKPEIGLT